MLSPRIAKLRKSLLNKRNNPASLFGKGTSVMIGKLSFSAGCQATVSKSAAIMTAFTLSLDSTFSISAEVQAVLIVIQVAADFMDKMATVASTLWVKTRT